MGIVRKEFYFQAANKGHEIFACFWMEEERSVYCGILQIAHGMAEHILRYEQFAIYLAKKGFLVCGNDHAGHGRSVEREEEQGFFGEDYGWLYLVEDMYYLMDFMKKKQPDLPYFLLGHSMGSFLAREFVYRYGQELSGAIFLGTSGGHPLIDLAITLCNREILKKGILKKGRSVYKLAFGAFNIKFLPRRTDFDWLSRDEKEVDQFIADEKCGFVFTYGGFRDLFCLLKRISGEAWSKGIPLDLPMLFASGDNDPVGDYGKGIEKIQEQLTKAGCSCVKVKIYEGGRHELLHEINQKEVCQYLFHWLEGILKNGLKSSF